MNHNSICKDKNAIVIFLIITFALSTICYYLRIKGGDAAAGMTSILMFCPAIAVFVVKVCFYRKEKLIGWNRCGFQFIILGIIIPVFYLGISYGIFWIINQKSFTGTIYTNSIGMLIVLIPSAIITAAGEEIGWRGFLLPKMAKVINIKTTVLICGLIWALWHFPLMIAGLYQTGTPIWYQLPVFTLQAVMMTVILAVLRLKSNSIWPAILIHASHNYFDQVICGPLTNTANSAYFVGETGIVTTVLLMIAAIYMVKKYGISA